ncbi:MAG: UDP-N-acetylmuramoyl-tripeptide--D-alanyl-D-alanine ligase [Pseudomonadota bacterium]
MHASLNELLSVVPGATLTAPASFSGVTTNSKTVEAGNLFVALRGERFDAHDFIEDVAALGAAAVVVERLPDGLPIPALIVPDTRYALGQIAQLWRKRFTMPLIGVTGSNGKTTVKEMIAAILSAAFGTDHFLATRGNLNNEIGVPLTLFNLNAQHRAAVVELGMNHPGEIARLTEIALPTVGVVNNAQREHQEFMASVAAVAAENGSVISGLSEEGCAVFPADDEFAPLWTSYAGSRRLITFALDKQASVTAQWRATDFGSEIKLNARGEQVSFVLSAAGQHNVRNALAACAATLAVGINLEIIARGLSDFTPVAGRLQKKQATNGAIVIDDTYNANPDSVRAAIDVLANAPAPRTLVLGDMGEVGSEGVAFHEEIGEYARARHIDQLFTVGELARHASRAFGRPARHFETMETLNEEVASVPPGASVLVKGSRFMKMERVVQKLTGAAMGGH